MACGCSDQACNCVVQGDLDVSVTGSGTPADPYVVSHQETTFAAVEGDGIEITPGGTYGHEPEVAVKLDPDSTADVSVGPDGLLVNLPTDDTVPELAFQPGMMMEFGGDTPPSGWLLCDGSLKSQATYPDLFAQILHKYNGGVDPGGGDFRLPDARGRATYGPKATDSLGDQDGGYGLESNIPKLHAHSDGSLAASAINTGIAIDPSTANQTGVAAGINATEESQLEAAGAAQPPGTAVNITIVSVADDGHIHSITDPGHGHDVTGATGTSEYAHLIVNKIIKY